jgi:hypothetical protein
MTASYDPLNPLLGFIYFIVVIIGGLCFYWLRRNCQWFYGICEIIAAGFVFYLTLYPSGFSFSVINVDVPVVSRWLSYFYGILAGIYIFVRGMSNIYEGASPRVRAIFDCLFANHFQQMRQSVSRSSRC